MKRVRFIWHREDSLEALGFIPIGLSITGLIIWPGIEWLWISFCACVLAIGWSFYVWRGK